MNSNLLIWATPVPYNEDGSDYPIGPTPEDASLYKGKHYLVLDIEGPNMNQEEEMAVSLVNGKGEIWTLSNRHLRVSSVESVEGKIIFTGEW